jgi:hypothetical protein
MERRLEFLEAKPENINLCIVCRLSPPLSSPGSECSQALLYYLL